MLIAGGRASCGDRELGAGKRHCAIRAHLFYNKQVCNSLVKDPVLSSPRLENINTVPDEGEEGRGDGQICCLCARVPRACLRLRPFALVCDVLCDQSGEGQPVFPRVKAP